MLSIQILDVILANNAQSLLLDFLKNFVFSDYKLHLSHCFCFHVQYVISIYISLVEEKTIRCAIPKSAHD